MFHHFQQENDMRIGSIKNPTLEQYEHIIGNYPVLDATGDNTDAYYVIPGDCIEDLEKQYPSIKVVMHSHAW